MSGEHAHGAEDAPEVTEEDVATMENPADDYDMDAPPEEIDRVQAEQAEVSERDAQWVSPRERVGGED